MGDENLVAAVLEDWRTAPVNEKLRQTLAPAEVSPEDIAAMRAVGVSDRAIEEAVYVCFLFNVMDRLTDAFDFKLPSTQGFQRNGRVLYTLGYRLSSIPGRMNVDASLSG